MRLTNIRALSSGANQYEIAVDHEVLGVIGADELLGLGLVLDMELDDSTYVRLKSSVGYAAYYRQALQHVSQRLRSKGEISTYLRQKGCDQENSTKIIEALAQLGLIDDRKLSEAFIHDASLTRPLSKRSIEQRLRQKQVAGEIISQQLEDYDDESALNKLIAKKSKLSAYQGKQAKFFRYLLSQGFDYQSIAAKIGPPSN